jgi:16S rRNA (cytosine967-C5)-methyltransferase
MNSARDQALDILLKWQTEDGYLDEPPVRGPGGAGQTSAPDRALITEITHGCLRWRRALDWFVARQTRRRPGPVARQILRMAAYECLFLNRVPNHAVASEAARLAAARASRSLPVVNAVVRAWTSRRTELPGELKALQDENPAIGWSLPSSLVRRWRRRFGADDTIALCRWCNTPPPLVARMRPSFRPSGDDAELAAAGLGVEPSPVDSRFLRIDGPAPRIVATRAWTEGRLYIQDENTALPVDLLAPSPGSSVLDACAAPGGKTAMLAEGVGPEGSVAAVERSPTRFERLRDNVHRLGLETIVAGCPGDIRDASIAPGPFDAVLVDAPCTNTGVLRRRPGARWRFTLRHLEEMTALQASILNAAAGRVRPGGTLVYATCSIEPEENVEQVRGFLDEAPGFVLEREIESVPPAGGSDGVYAARLRRYP